MTDLKQASHGEERFFNSVNIGCYIISFLRSVLHSFLSAFVFAYFWVAAAAIYLLLRQNNDQTELDDIYFSEEETSTDGLPQLEFDAAGVPQVPEP